MPHLYQPQLPGNGATGNGVRTCSSETGTRYNSYVFKQPGMPEIEAVDKMKGKPDEWMVLLRRVGSDGNAGFCFWDARNIFCHSKK
jgi:hypothetical protein